MGRELDATHSGDRSRCRARLPVNSRRHGLRMPRRLSRKVPARRALRVLEVEGQLKVMQRVAEYEGWRTHLAADLNAIRHELEERAALTTPHGAAARWSARPSGPRAGPSRSRRWWRRIGRRRARTRPLSRAVLLRLTKKMPARASQPVTVAADTTSGDVSMDGNSWRGNPTLERFHELRSEVHGVLETARGLTGEASGPSRPRWTRGLTTSSWPSTSPG